MIQVIEMGDDGSEKIPRPPPHADDEDDAEASAKLLENGVMAAADRIEPDKNGKTEIEVRDRMH